jgi:protein-L-isoaspartate(D-aspartate) O-methyltransferase
MKTLVITFVGALVLAGCGSVRYPTTYVLDFPPPVPQAPPSSGAFRSLAAEIYTIEIIPELAQTAARTLRELGYANVTVRQGDGYQGWPEQAPFDRIIVTAAPPQVPEALLGQLSPGGLLVVPVGPAGYQELLLIEKKPDGSLRRQAVCPVSFVPMTPARK